MKVSDTHACKHTHTAIAYPTDDIMKSSSYEYAFLWAEWRPVGCSPRSQLCVACCHANNISSVTEEWTSCVYRMWEMFVCMCLGGVERVCVCVSVFPPLIRSSVIQVQTFAESICPVAWQWCILPWQGCSCVTNVQMVTKRTLMPLGPFWWRGSFLTEQVEKQQCVTLLFHFIYFSCKHWTSPP